MKQAKTPTPVSRRLSPNFRRSQGRYLLSMALFWLGLFGSGAILFLLCMVIGLRYGETRPTVTLSLWVGILYLGGGFLYCRYRSGRTLLIKQKRGVLCVLTRNDLAETRRRRDRLRRLFGWLKIFVLPFLVVWTVVFLVYLLVSAVCCYLDTRFRKIINLRKK